MLVSRTDHVQHFLHSVRKKRSTTDFREESTPRPSLDLMLISRMTTLNYLSQDPTGTWHHLNPPSPGQQCDTYGNPSSNPLKFEVFSQMELYSPPNKRQGWRGFKIDVKLVTFQRS